jgi:transposase-like protein
MALSFKGAYFPKEVILMGARWYVAYPLSTRHVEKLMEERGVDVDHSTINDTVGEFKSAEICVSHMPSWKAKTFGKLTQKKVLLELCNRFANSIMLLI